MRIVLFVFAAIACLLFLTSTSTPAIRQLSLRKPSVSEPQIPNQVWQCYTTVGPRNTSITHHSALKATKIGANIVASWFPVDGDWSYRFIGSEVGTKFVKEHFKYQQDVVDVYTSLRVPVMVSDFLRYLLLAGEGGIYADSDVEMIKPLQDWVPEDYRNVTRAMVGIEVDHASKEAEDDGWAFRFTQHTLVAAKGHPIMTNMVRNVTDKMLALAEEKHTKMSELELHDRDVVRITGPRGFKDIVFEHLSKETDSTVGWRNLTGMKEPKLFGDTLIVPINFFAGGQSHSGSDGSSPDKRVQHYWKGTWRHWDESM
ncbi:MAG: hypothetical protein Q9195_004158 [Heterodermia aff. obscurata]